MMVTFSDLRALRSGIERWVEDRLRNITARLILRTVITTASEGEGGRSALVDAVEGHLPADGSQPSSDDVERAEYAGFLIVPVPKGPAIRLGDNSPAFLLPLAHPSYRPGGGKQGETCVYNLSRTQATRWIRQNGKIEDRSSGGAKLTLDEAGKVAAEAAGGAKLEMDLDTLVTTLLRATHFGGNAAAPPPTVVGGAALRGGGAAIFGTDASFRLSLTVGVAGVPIAGPLCTVTFGTPYDSAPQFSIAATGPNPLFILAGAIPVGTAMIRSQATQVQLDIATDLPIATGSYQLSVLVKQ